MKMMYLKSTKLKQFKQLYIGVLSGTGMNSIDAALVEFAGPSTRRAKARHPPSENEGGYLSL